MTKVSLKFKADRSEETGEYEEETGDYYDVPDEYDHGHEPKKAADDKSEEPLDGEGECYDKSAYPEWTWNHVNTYVAIRRSDKYTDDQIKALARQDIVMLEKTNGADAYGSVEKGSLEAAKRIKKINSKVKILFYLNAVVHYGQYDANVDFKEEWAMVKSDGEFYKWRDKYLSYNHNNDELRQWWIKRALDMMEHDEIDGIFIDALCKTDRGFLPARKHGDGWLKTARQLRERMPEGKLLIGNAIRARVMKPQFGNWRMMQYLDGSYLEGWRHDGPTLTKTLQLMSKCLKEGRIVMLNASPGVSDETINKIQTLNERYEFLGKPEYINFPLGFFLLVVEKNAYFSWHWGVHAKPRAKCVWDNSKFEALTRKLGKPMGDYVDEGDGEYSREFQYLKVHVNVNTQVGKLTVKGDKEEL